jgi:hypothetical protein
VNVEERTSTHDGYGGDIGRYGRLSDGDTTNGGGDGHSRGKDTICERETGSEESQDKERPSPGLRDG